MALNELTRDELIEVVLAQAVFTDGLRRVSNVALSHAGHIISNYASGMPDTLMQDWANAQIDATALLTHPAPVEPPVRN